MADVWGRRREGNVGGNKNVIADNNKNLFIPQFITQEETAQKKW